MKFVSDYFIDKAVAWLNYKMKINSAPLCDFSALSKSLNPCDVILVEGRSRAGQIIKICSLSHWSHAAIYIGRLCDIHDEELKLEIKKHYSGKETDQLLIETEIGTGTSVQNIELYAGEHLRVCRPRGLTNEDTQHVFKFLKNKLGCDYGIRQAIELLRFFFPYALLPRNWRSSLFNYAPGDATKVVCSTLIAEAFYTIDYPILPLIKVNADYEMQLYQMNPMFCAPCDFDHSPYFQTLKFPFYDFKESSHDLPWRGRGSLHKDEDKRFLTQRDVKILKNVVNKVGGQF